jgi:two-component system sensor histidine kinase BaeS
VSIRWRLFFSYLAVIVALVVALSIGVRMVGIRAVNGHMAGMTTGMMGTMARDLQNAVTAGLNEAVLWGALAAIVVALVASYVISWWITRPLELLAQAADGVASGDYGRRVGYAARDEIGKFAASFNDMAGQLEKTEEVRRELLGTISHEIRTPLANIEGYMQGLVDGVVPSGPSWAPWADYTLGYPPTRAPLGLNLRRVNVLRVTETELMAMKKAASSGLTSWPVNG